MVSTQQRVKMMKTLKYKGYTGSIEFSKDDACYYGKVQGLIEDCITYEGEDVATLEEDFHAAVDYYLTSCAQRGIAPHRPYSGTLSLRLSPDEHSRVAQLARKAGISVNAYVRNALALL